jgi:hypothetical protein
LRKLTAPAADVLQAPAVDEPPIEKTTTLPDAPPVAIAWYWSPG